MFRLLAGLFLLILSSACQKDYSLETGRKPGDEVCGRLDRIIHQPGTADENSFRFSYDEKGTLVALSDSAAGKTYNLAYNSSGKLISKSAPGSTTLYTYDSSGRLATVSFTYPLPSRYEFFYGTGNIPEEADFYQEKNGALALMYNQLYFLQDGNISGIDYDSIGIIRKESWQADMGTSTIPLMSLLQIGSDFSWGYPQPATIYFNRNLPAVWSSQRHGVTYQYAYSYSGTKLSSYTRTDQLGNQVLWVFEYNCL